MGQAQHNWYVKEWSRMRAKLHKRYATLFLVVLMVFLLVFSLQHERLTEHNQGIQALNKELLQTSERTLEFSENLLRQIEHMEQIIDIQDKLLMEMQEPLHEVRELLGRIVMDDFEATGYGPD